MMIYVTDMLCVYFLQNKVSSSFINSECYLCLISLKNKAGPVENMHVQDHITCNFHVMHPYSIYVIECISMVTIVGSSYENV